MPQTAIQDPRTIIILGEPIRKWWRLELRLAKLHETGAPGNPWSGAAQALNERFQAEPLLRKAIVLELPDGGSAAGAPVYSDGRYVGTLLVHGFVRQASTGPAARPALAPSELEKLLDLLELGARELERPAPEEEPGDVPASGGGIRGLIGRSRAMEEIVQLVYKLARSDTPLYIQGESGTGKELVARAIHEHGPRRDRPFVAQNCSALNDNLLESALFGHVRGAFTGAHADRKGLFELADGGTFFLDEVGEMSPALQAKLLRVLQEGTFTPLGGSETRRVDVRLITATHRDLEELVRQGRLREDLFYRINVIRLEVPPLRERTEDLPLLVEHFFRKHRRRGQRARKLSAEAMELLQGHSWPGNVRELENEVERLLVLGGEEEEISAERLSPRLRRSAEPRPALHARAATGKLSEAVEQLEREMIRQGLLRTGANRSRLARELGISRSNLIMKIAKYGLGRGPDLEDGGPGDAGPPEQTGA